MKTATASDRQKAIATKRTTYAGRKCKKNWRHGTERYTISGNCVGCQRKRRRSA